jgi:hypothetical protein
VSAIDEFANSLLEEAKRFLEKAESAGEGARPFLHAALMLAFCSLEAHINATADEFAERPELSVHERAFLLEQDVTFEAGAFRSGGLKMTRIEDRILFIHLKFGGRALDRNAVWWGSLREAIRLRNKLTHPKEVPAISVDNVKRAIEAIIECINVLFMAVYQKPFPVATRGLHSKLNF